MDDGKLNGQPLPMVVQVGFAGSRRLLDTSEHPGVDRMAFEAEIGKWLAQRLQKLRRDLSLESRHFICGIASLAAGGDTLFHKACSANGIVQRIFLPQTRCEFLRAVGSDSRDFSKPQRDEALEFLKSDCVIQERMVSDAPRREERFEDVNREITRVSDVLICLLREDSRGKPGGTEDLAARAVQRGKPVLVIRVGVADGKPVFTEEWRLPTNEQTPHTDPARAFERPREPQTLASVQMPAPGDGTATPIERYATAVKLASSATAGEMREKFKLMAIAIIGTHIIATLLATVALGFPKFEYGIIPALLGLELVMLGVGLTVHKWLEHTRTVHRWAEARLLAEVARSVLAVGNLHLYLEYLFSLPFPATIRPLLRTLNVLQLQSTRQDRADWTLKRDRYVEKRLTMPNNGQIDFYGHRSDAAEKRLRRLHRWFIVFWTAAFSATLIKLSLDLKDKAIPRADVIMGTLGTLAIVMPVLAAAALSLAAALDLDAQKHTYREMLAFLQQQKKNLQSATSERDYAKLVLETESRLLGETANWFSRRSFTGLA